MICAGDEIGQWVVEKVGGAWTGVHETAIGWKVDGVIRCGCMFEKYTPSRSVVAHWAIDRFSRDFLLVCFRYAFLQLEVNCVIAVVDESNEKAMSLNKKIGFKECGRIPEAAQGGDLVIMNIDKIDYLRIENKYGRQI